MPTLMMILATILWGATYPLMKIAMQQLNPMGFVFLRFFVATIFSIPFLFLYRKQLNKKTLIAGAIIGLCIAVTVLLQSAGIRTIPASVSAFLSGCAILFVVGFRAIATRTKPTLIDISTTSLCMFGLALVTGGGNLAWEIGILYTLLGSVLIAVHILLMDKYSKEGNGFVVTLLQCIFGTIYSIGSLGEIIEKADTLTASVWSSVIFCGTGCSIIAFGLQAYSQKFLDPKRIAMIFMLEPVFGTIISYFYLGEDVINAQFLIGASLILGSITYLSIKMNKG